MGDAEKYAPGFGGYIFTQSALLFCSYGLGYAMPWWVRWFPSLFLPVFIVLALFTVFIAALVTK
jgi:hypothetical protein